MSKLWVMRSYNSRVLVIAEAKPWDNRKRDLTVLGKRD